MHLILDSPNLGDHLIESSATVGKLHNLTFVLKKKLKII